MWDNLPIYQKKEYKEMILAFASLTEMFAQKNDSDEDKVQTPFINSKYQEKVFQKVFGASGEDVGNTAYDAALECNGQKYLVGIKTFLMNNDAQKIAQFKSQNEEWAGIVEQIKSNSVSLEKKEIDKINYSLYLELAKRISKIRNERIDSACANIKGFRLESKDRNVESIYHVLMPLVDEGIPKVYVGETSYEKIDIDNLSVLGCTTKNNPTNFLFTDGKHKYKYTPADCQLYMHFSNENIVCDRWNVKYAKDAYNIFKHISEIVASEDDKNSEQHVLVESYCWTIWNKNKEVELYSGFNSFNGVGTKLARNKRQEAVQKFFAKHECSMDYFVQKELGDAMRTFLIDKATASSERYQKGLLRNRMMIMAETCGNLELRADLEKILFRPYDEVYIPIPNAANFHRLHPDFFGKNFGALKPGSSKLSLKKEQRVFNLVFEPSGDSIPVYIAQDFGKAIESVEKQSYLGEWILRGVFQLGKYEPLTSQKLYELNINGMRFSKYGDSADIHIEFIWIDEDNPPKDYISK